MFFLILYVSTLHHKPHQTTSNHIKPHQTTSNHIKPHQTTSNHSGVHAKLRFQRDWREVDWGGIGNVDWTKSSCWECRVIRTVCCMSHARFNPIQSDSIRFNPIQSDSIRFNPIQSDSIRFNPIQSDSAANEWYECSNTLKHAQTLRLAFKCNRLHNLHNAWRSQTGLHSCDVSGKQNTHTRTLYKVSLHAAVFLRWQSLENQVWFYSWKICWWKIRLVFTKIHKTRNHTKLVTVSYLMNWWRLQNSFRAFDMVRVLKGLSHCYVDLACTECTNSRESRDTSREAREKTYAAFPILKFNCINNVWAWSSWAHGKWFAHVRS